MPDFLNGLFFSEILADNAGRDAVNVNGVNGANKQDEFVEIQNSTGAPIDLSGYQIWSDRNGLLHSFGTGATIAPGDTATVVGTYTNPPPGSGFYGANGVSNGASGGGGFLEDGEGSKFDTLYLVAPNGDYIRLSYGEPPQDPGGLPAGFPTGGTLQGSGETVNSGAPNGVSLLRDSNGDMVEGTPTPDAPGFVCFASGTMIETDAGNMAVDDLRPGHLIGTLDRGFVPLRAIRRATFGRRQLARFPELRPITIPAGVLGLVQPLSVSPAHRMLLSGSEADLMFGAAEVLVAAHHLVGQDGVQVDATASSATYHHLLLDAHHLIRANGCWAESLYLGDAAHRAMEAAGIWQVEAGLDLRALHHEGVARPVLRGYEAAALIAAQSAVEPRIAA